MALVAVPPFFLPTLPIPQLSGFTSFLTSSMDASGDRIAGIFIARTALTISKIAVRYGSVTTAGQVAYRIETVGTGTDATPTGTLWATNTATGNLTPVANSIVEGTLTANATLAAGDVFAIVIAVTSTPINMNVSMWNTSFMSIQSGQIPYGSVNASGSYVNSAELPVVGMFDTTTSTWPMLAQGHPLLLTCDDTSVINTGTGATTGTKRGVRFQLPVPQRLSGLNAKISAVTTADFNVELYDGGGTLLATLLSGVDASRQRSAGGAYPWYLPFATPYACAAATEYYLVITPTTANNVTLYECTVTSAAHWDTWGGQQYYLAAFVSSAWVETTTTRPYLWPEFDQLDDGGPSNAAIASAVWSYANRTTT